MKFLSPINLHENKDSLSIFDGQRIVEKLTGYIAFPKRYESVANTMYVEMDSSTFRQTDGFLAQVSVISAEKIPEQQMDTDHHHNH